MSETSTNLKARREEIVRAHIAAENNADVDGTIASFHHPCYQVMPMGGVFDGEDAVRGLLSGLLAGFPDFYFEAIKTHHAESAVIVEGKMRGTHRGEWAGMPPSGKTMEVPVACIFDFEEDRLMNETVYFDFATLQRQLSAA